MVDQSEKAVTTVSSLARTCSGLGSRVEDKDKGNVKTRWNKVRVEDGMRGNV